MVDQTTGLPVAGCLASWFNTGEFPAAIDPSNPSNVLPVPITVAPSTPITVTDSLSLIESGTNQGACENVNVEVNLAVS